MTKLKRLHHRQTVVCSKFVVKSAIPRIDIRNGEAELVSRICKRNLSIFDHSCTERLRNATTTPANPANVTATCALALNASLGCIFWPLLTLQHCAPALLAGKIKTAGEADKNPNARSDEGTY